ncbi:unnamed protein product [Brassica oleracea]|uniref:(rape) hypothetical protein n=1 Tax=Brassica napus TaxID=3708 RepID=A0A816L1V0_BRANA|nr:unnamed protein product [Brassica napus]
MPLFVIYYFVAGNWKVSWQRSQRMELYCFLNYNHILYKT